MPRDCKLYLEDILTSIDKIQKYTKKMSFDKFKINPVVVDAVVRNLEILGEASKNIPADIKNKHKKVEWKKIAGLRDILAHEYFGVDLDVLWDIIQNKLPELKINLKDLF